MESAKDFAEMALLAFERSLPVLLLGYMTFSSIVMYQITFVRIILAGDEFAVPGFSRALGLGLCLPWLLFFFGFVSSIMTAWYYSWMVAPFWRPFGPLSHPIWLRPLLPVTFVSARFKAWYRTMARPVSSRKPPVLRWQQASPPDDQLIAVSDFWIMERGPRTIINKCVRDEGPCLNANRRRRDRMYHAYWPLHADGLVSTCLPVYDHWCHFICVLVYLHSIKAYILTMTYLVLYSIYVGVVIAWASSKPEFDDIKRYMLAAKMASGFAVVYLTGYNLVLQLHRLVFSNHSGYEIRHPDIFFMAFPVADTFVLRRAPANPWDQGSWRKNWTHTMGPGWLAWIPFWQPQRVRDYDDPAKYDFDEKFGPEFEKWAASKENSLIRDIDRLRREGAPQAPPATHRRRRDEASSTGVDV